MSIRLLGALELVDDAGTQIDIGGPQPRIMLALLVAADGKLVAVDALIDAIWDTAPPVSATGTLQTYVSRLRRALAEVGGSIVHEPGGYRLVIRRDAIDADRFEVLVGRAREALDTGEPAAARSLLVEAELLWRGPALLDLRDRPRTAGIARRLDDRRLAALEDRIAADLALGRHTHVVPELAQLVGEHPLRERLWELLALARFRSGLQADALRAISQARSTLVEELGVEPGTGLRDLEQAILAHDPSLDYVPIGNHKASATRANGAEGVEAAGNVRRRRPVPTTTLVGRDAELALLMRALDDAAARHPTIAIVQGEAGVGKTRLVEELAAETTRRGGAVVWGRSLEGGAAPAYWPWLRVLRTLRAWNPGESNAALDQLLDGTGSGASEPVAADDSQLLDGLLGLSRRTNGAAGPALIIVIEDVQWADVESLELTTRLVSGLTDEALLLVLTMREGDAARRDPVIGLLATVSRRLGTLRLRLDGLTPSGTATLLTEVSGRPIDDEFARVVHERVEGNPFYAIELQRLLDAEGLVDVAAVSAVGIPVGVRDVIRQRLTRLPQPTLDLLRIAAVAGREIDVELISHASGRPIEQCLDDLEVALEHRVLIDGGQHAGPRFAHALVREVVVDDLSSLRRARTHLLLADAIVGTGGGDDAAEIVAEHLWAAVPIGAGRRAAEALDRAADVAIARFAVAAAGDMLTRSLELRRSVGADATEELDTLVKLVWARRARDGYPGGLPYYQRGAELADRLGRGDIEVEMQWAEWAAHDTACAFDRARPVAMRFRDWATSSNDPVVQLAGLTAWAIQCWHDGDLAESAATFRTVAHLHSSIGSLGGTVSLAAELAVLSTAFGLYLDEQVGWSADPDGAFAATADAVSGNFPVAILWAVACTSATSAGDLERVERYSRRVLAAEAGETLGFWGSQARMYLGTALIATGRAPEGRALFDTGLEGYLGAGMHTGLALMLAAASSAEAIAGDLDRAAAHLAAAQDELGRGERWPIPYVLLASADLAEASGAAAEDVLAARSEAEAIAAAQGAVVAVERARAAIRGERWCARQGAPPQPSMTAPR